MVGLRSMKRPASTGMCERVCAPASITRKATKLENGDQEIDFSFDLTSCTFCGTCADFSATKSITLTDDYMMVGTTPEDFMVRATFIKKAPPKPKFTPEQLAEMKKGSGQGLPRQLPPQPRRQSNLAACQAGRCWHCPRRRVSTLYPPAGHGVQPERWIRNEFTEWSWSWKARPGIEGFVARLKAASPPCGD